MNMDQVKEFDFGEMRVVTAKIVEGHSGITMVFDGITLKDVRIKTSDCGRFPSPGANGQMLFDVPKIPGVVLSYEGEEWLLEWDESEDWTNINVGGYESDSVSGYYFKQVEEIKEKEHPCPHAIDVDHGKLLAVQCALTSRLCTCVEWADNFSRALQKATYSDCPGYMLHDVAGMEETRPQSKNQEGRKMVVKRVTVTDNLFVPEDATVEELWEAMEKHLQEPGWPSITSEPTNF